MPTLPSVKKEDKGIASSAEPAPKLPAFADLEKDELSSEDLEEFQRLLEQKQDVTRQDITAQDFQSLLSRYTKD